MRILFVDRSTKLETIHDLTTKARGGMVTSLFKVSDYLAWAGHDVTVLSDIECDGVTAFGTKWLHEIWGRYDVLVANRGIGDGYPQIDAKARILWTHDLPHSGFIPDPKNIRAFDCTVFMSRYAEAVWRTFYRDIGKSVYIPNGVTRQLFKPGEKDPNLFVYASAPNRGLSKLPFLLDCVRARTSDDVRFEAYSNFAKLHPGELGEGDDPYDYQPIEESSVVRKDPLPQREFAQVLSRASGLLMPSAYAEICSNLILQALSAGTPVFTTGGTGSAPEWVRHRKNGMLTEFQPMDYMVYTVEMVRNLSEYVLRPRLQRKLQRGAARTKIHSWKEIGSQWESLMTRYC
jgi:glycosyltransferase involved in cell wall biosynthesis